MYTADIVTQLKNIMPSLGLGFALGLVYEFVRILRVLISSGKIFVFVTDVIFTVFCAVSSFLLFVAVDNGHIRFYMLLSCVIGYVICLFTAGELIYKFFLRIHGAIVKILTPILRPFVFVSDKIILRIKKGAENAEKFKNKFKKLLKRSDNMLYNKDD